ncbi:MAGE-like protein 2 isoform X1 [Motacilla alba alba]|uniref:MAGE-like protein 2 isoform X1 n=1 Tax=Motacilla alba alba TaxID=1094192 RepID=UPI0018D5517A|nr:MAGE-like protein 2 isoform X1 [Motacilla alba alba]
MKVMVRSLLPELLGKGRKELQDPCPPWNPSGASLPLPLWSISSPLEHPFLHCNPSGASLLPLQSIWSILSFLDHPFPSGSSFPLWRIPSCTAIPLEHSFPSLPPWIIPFLTAIPLEHPFPSGASFPALQSLWSIPSPLWNPSGASLPHCNLSGASLLLWSIPSPREHPFFHSNPSGIPLESLPALQSLWSIPCLLDHPFPSGASLPHCGIHLDHPFPSGSSLPHCGIHLDHPFPSGSPFSHCNPSGIPSCTAIPLEHSFPSLPPWIIPFLTATPLEHPFPSGASFPALQSLWSVPSPLWNPSGASLPQGSIPSPLQSLEHPFSSGASLLPLQSL